MSEIIAVIRMIPIRSCRKSANQPQANGPIIRVICNMDMSNEICIAVNPMASKYKLK